MIRRPAPLALTLFAACHAGGTADEPRIPFHVALAPITVSSLKWQHDEGAPAEDEQAFQLVVPPEAVRALEVRLRDTLQRESFVQVSALPPAAGALSDSTAEHAARALAAGADLLLECNLQFNPAVVHELDGTFVFNLPVWLFLGPVSWAVEDNNYVASAQLTAQFYDLGQLHGAADRTARPPDRLLTVTPGFEAADLSLAQRNGWAVYKYLPSLIIPPGFLFRGSQRTQEQVRNEILDALVEGLADAVRQRSEDLVQERQRQGGAFYLAPETLALRPAPDGGWTVSCELVLDPYETVDELYELTVEDEDGRTLHSQLLEQVPIEIDDGGDQRYRLEFPLAPPAGTLRVKLVVTDQRVRRRTFTIALPPRASPGGG